MSVTSTFLPIILTLVCGYAMAQRGHIDKAGWNAIETLSFRLLIPIVLIKSIALSELAPSEFAGLIGATVLTLCLATLIVFAYRALLGSKRLPDPDFTTLVQSTTRWNAFIALAVADLMIGSAALTLIAAAMAILIPLINVFNIVMLAQYGTAKVTPLGVLQRIAQNPLVQGCFIGLALNFSGINLPEVAVQTLELIGRAALGIGLLTVGAALSVKRLLYITPSIAAGVIFRLGVCPMTFIALAPVFGLSELEVISGLLILAVPAAANGYIVARQMGGNAALYADLLSWHTILSMILLPVLITTLT